MTERIRIPYDVNQEDKAFHPRPYQLEFLTAKTRFKGAIWHRRGGKSKTVLNEQIAKCQIKKGIYYYFLPTYKQAKQVIWDELIRAHVPDAIVAKRNESELAIYYRNGSIQRFVGCDDIDKHRGINPIDVVFDEYSEMSEKIWTAIIQPVLRENHGTATFIFTPKGKNHAHRLYMMTKDNPEWFWSIKTVNDTGGLTPEEIKEAKQSTPEALFRQEYLCSFEEGAGQFFRRVRQNITHAKLYPQQGYEYQLGVDLAKYQDWTVLTPFCLNTFEVGTQDRFNQVDWNLQKARVKAAHFQWNKARTILDSTGVGDPIAEDLQNDGIDLTVRWPDKETIGFKFNETSRRQLLDNLAILLEQDKIKIPNDEGLIDELESFSLKVTENGRIKVIVPDGMTDDRVMSLALAVWGAPEEPYGVPQQESPDNLYDKYSLI